MIYNHEDFMQNNFNRTTKDRFVCLYLNILKSKTIRRILVTTAIHEQEGRRRQNNLINYKCRYFFGINFIMVFFAKWKLREVFVFQISSLIDMIFRWILLFLIQSTWQIQIQFKFVFVQILHAIIYIMGFITAPFQFALLWIQLLSNLL